MQIMGIFAAMGVVAGTTTLSTTMGFSSRNHNEKHPLEDRKSWDLHIARQLGEKEPIVNPNATVRRFLGTNAADTNPPQDESSSEILPYSVKHKIPKKHIPFAGGDTTHGMMIDAGSVSMVQ